MSSTSPDAEQPADRDEVDPSTEEVEPGGAAPDEASRNADDAANTVEAVDPDAPGAALVDPDLEQAEPNEPG